MYVFSVSTGRQKVCEKHGYSHEFTNSNAVSKYSYPLLFCWSHDSLCLMIFIMATALESVIWQLNHHSTLRTQWAFCFFLVNKINHYAPVKSLSLTLHSCWWIGRPLTYDLTLLPKTSYVMPLIFSKLLVHAMYFCYEELDCHVHTGKRPCIS